MRIIINAAFLPDIYSLEYNYVLFETMKRLGRNHAEHEFFFVSDVKDSEQFDLEDNIKLIKIKTRKRNSIVWKYWYDVKIPALLRKYKADLFISPGFFCSLNTKVPQVLLVADSSFENLPFLFTRSQLSFIKKRKLKSIAKAKAIITFTKTERDKLNAVSKATEAKTSLIPLIVPEKNIPGSDLFKGQAKTKYTEGKEFFFYNGNLDTAGNIMNLLKAFSLFKKRQQSNFKLVICGNEPGEHKEYVKLLQTYKYKTDVVLINNLENEELTQLFVSAYAFVYPVLLNNFLTPVLQAMQSDIPVITSSNPSFEEITENAALYVKAENPQDIADSMMRIYKDEKLRNELIGKGKSIINRLKQQDAAGGLLEALQKAVS